MKKKLNPSVAIMVVLIVMFVTVNELQAKIELSESAAKSFLEEKAAIIEPGVMPDSFWYWADIFSEEIQFLFTVGKESKGDFMINVAKERLAEMKKLSEAG